MPPLSPKNVSPNPERPNAALAWLALAGASATLICCALPALLVFLGAGAVVAGLVTVVPGIVVFSENKELVFAIAGALLAAAAAYRIATRNAPCPADPAAAQSCQRLRRLGSALLGLSLALYVVGFFFAYVAPLILL